MVTGLEIFSAHFSNFKDCYALIGGSACFLVLDDVGLQSRATKDLDIVLCIENFNADFARAFWDFINDANYVIKQRSNGKPCFYRFNKPENTDYPKQLELFSRNPDSLELSPGTHLTPIPTDNELSSLSAILLNENYYSLVIKGKSVINNISIVAAEYLIPLKVRAWLDLTKRKKSGENIRDREIEKHGEDVIRLYQLITPGSRIDIGETVRDDMRTGFAGLIGVLPDILTGTDIEQIDFNRALGEMSLVYGIK